MNASRRVLPILLLCGLGLGCGEDRAPTGPAVPISRVEIQPEADTVMVGETAQFTAVAYDTFDAPAQASIAWSSEDSQIFQVGPFGLVRGVGEGTARLFAEAGGRSDTAWVTVVPDTGWVLQPSGTTAELNAVFFLPDGRTGWAAGAGGTIVRTRDAGASWQRLTTSTTFSLSGIWFTSATEGWAVGAAGTVLRTTNGGDSWTRLTNVGVGDALEDVWFANADVGWIVGGSGLVLRTADRGVTWQRTRLPTAFAVLSVSFSGLQDGWAVGANGVIAGTHDGGLSWFVTPSLTLQTLRAVWRRSEPVAFAVGSQGWTPRTIVGPDSTVWEARTAGTTRQLEGVEATSDLTVFAVGYDASLGGAILRSDDGGLTWRAQASRTQNRLHDVFFVDPLRGWAVGEAGTIVHTARGGE